MSSAASKHPGPLIQELLRRGSDPENWVDTLRLCVAHNDDVLRFQRLLDTSGLAAVTFPSISVAIPTLMVMGTQSSGKSSLLNALLNTDMLPVNTDLATRGSVSLHFRPMDEGAYFRKLAGSSFGSGRDVTELRAHWGGIFYGELDLTAGPNVTPERQKLLITFGRADSFESANVMDYFQSGDGQDNTADSCRPICERIREFWSKSGLAINSGILDTATVTLTLFHFQFIPCDVVDVPGFVLHPQQLNRATTDLAAARLTSLASSAGPLTLGTLSHVSVAFCVNAAVDMVTDVGCTNIAQSDNRVARLLQSTRSIAVLTKADTALPVDESRDRLLQLLRSQSHAIANLELPFKQYHAVSVVQGERLSSAATDHACGSHVGLESLSKKLVAQFQVGFSSSFCTARVKSSLDHHILFLEKLTAWMDDSARSTALQNIREKLTQLVKARLKSWCSHLQVATQPSNMFTSANILKEVVNPVIESPQRYVLEAAIQHAKLNGSSLDAHLTHLAQTLLAAGVEKIHRAYRDLKDQHDAIGLAFHNVPDQTKEKALLMAAVVQNIGAACRHVDEQAVALSQPLSSAASVVCSSAAGLVMQAAALLDRARVLRTAHIQMGAQ